MAVVEAQADGQNGLGADRSDIVTTPQGGGLQASNRKSSTPLRRRNPPLRPGTMPILQLLGNSLKPSEGLSAVWETLRGIHTQP
ncbi:hypothetical protein WJX73_003172 [Symbiochloris irregularis]|uniref:Uncharacterized protein n=1 Tax=Symbiochloris irregularis TaxID=706552 RepID=A0AAW1NZQ3_9CHLO